MKRLALLIPLLALNTVDAKRALPGQGVQSMVDVPTVDAITLLHNRIARELAQLLNKTLPSSEAREALLANGPALLRLDWQAAWQSTQERTSYYKQQNKTNEDYQVNKELAALAAQYPPLLLNDYLTGTQEDNTSVHKEVITLLKKKLSTTRTISITPQLIRECAQAYKDIQNRYLNDEVRIMSISITAPALASFFAAIEKAFPQGMLLNDIVQFKTEAQSVIRLLEQVHAAAIAQGNTQAAQAIAHNKKLMEEIARCPYNSQIAASLQSAQEKLRTETEAKQAQISEHRKQQTDALEAQFPFAGTLKQLNAALMATAYQHEQQIQEMLGEIFKNGNDVITFDIQDLIKFITKYHAIQQEEQQQLTALEKQTKAQLYKQHPWAQLEDQFQKADFMANLTAAIAPNEWRTIFGKSLEYLKHNA